MFLVGHAVVGMLLTSATGTQNPAAAFGIGWASHYLADFFPHGDEEIGAWTKKGGHEIRRLLFVVGIDALLLAGASAIYIAVNGFSWALVFAAAGSAVPDVIWGMEKVLKRPIIPVLEKFHDKNHNFINLRMPAWAGLLLQAAVTTALWATLITRF